MSAASRLLREATLVRFRRLEVLRCVTSSPGRCLSSVNARKEDRLQEAGQDVPPAVRRCCIAGSRSRGEQLRGARLSRPAPESLSTAPGFAVLRPAANHAVPTQDRDLARSRDRRLFRLPGCAAAGRQPAGPDQHPVAWPAVEVALPSHRTVVLTCRERIKPLSQVAQLHRASGSRRQTYLQACPAPPPPTRLLQSASLPRSAPSRPCCSQL